MNSWMPALWNVEPQQVIGAGYSISRECLVAGSVAK